jgi:hypothetical protein
LELISGFGTKLMQEHKTGRTSMVDPEMAMRLPTVKSPSQISTFFAVRRRADRAVTLSQIVHLRAVSHE